MIEKILGVVCLTGASLLYTAERIVSRSSQFAAFREPNGCVIALTILGSLLLIAGYRQFILSLYEQTTAEYRDGWYARPIREENDNR